MNVRTLLVILCVSSFLSCSSEYESWGVVMWSHDEVSLPTGSLVGVIGQSAVQKNLRVQPLPSNGTIVETDVWRIRTFPSLGDAERWISSNEAILKSFAICGRQALPVRAKADRQADMVYRLRDGEQVKIIGKDANLTKEGEYENYWYEILTETGTTGWTFGAYLTLFEQGGASVSSRGGQQVDVAARIKSSLWRPKEFRDMIQKQKFDLEVFAPEHGFFIDTQEKRFHISNGKVFLEGTYTGFSPASGQDSFTIDGTDYLITFLKDGTLKVDYVQKGSPGTAEFTVLKDQIASIVSEEQARRQLILRKFSNSAARLSSAEAGDFTMEGNRFTWTGADLFKGRGIPGNAGTTGTVKADLYVEGAARSSFQGAVSLWFDGTKPEQRVPCLYNLGPAGVELMILPASAVTDLVIEALPADAPTVEFSRIQ